MSNSLIEVKDLKVYFKQKSPKPVSYTHLRANETPEKIE